MIKKESLFFLICVLLILICGCETIKGACTGAEGGLRKDWDNIKKADAWMQENLW